MALATVKDVEDRLGRPLTDAEKVQVDAWLTDLEAQALARGVDLAALIEAGTLSAAVVTAIACSAVIRVLNNPKGVRQRTVSIDDYSTSETIDSAASAGLLYFTDAEWELLAPGNTGDAFTIRSYGEPDCRRGWWVHPDQWVPYP